MTHKRVCVGIRSCLQKQLCTLNMASKTSIMKGCPSILHTQCTNSGKYDQIIHTWAYKWVTHTCPIPVRISKRATTTHARWRMIARRLSHWPGTDIDGQWQTLQTTDIKSEEAAVCKLWFTSVSLSASAPACSSSSAHLVWPLPQALWRGVLSSCTHNAQIMVTMMIETWTFKYKLPLSGSCLRIKASYHNSCTLAACSPDISFIGQALILIRSARQYKPSLR
jgi:hypothetical protein